MKGKNVLNPFDPAEAIGTTEAAHMADVSDRTIRNWVLEHDIGRKVGGHNKVSKPALTMFIEGDTGALADYHAGERTARVQSYFERHDIQASASSDFAAVD
jgi:hypothetical protein